MATPDQIIADARSYAGNIQSQATSAIAATLNAIAGTALPWSANPAFKDLEVFNGVEIDKLPDTTPIDFVIPGEPSTAVPYQDISAIELGVIPEFDTAAPVFDSPNKPNQLSEFTQVAPVINTSFTFPEPPDALANPNIPVPAMAGFVAPEKPELLMPEMTTSAPVFGAVEPADLQKTVTDAYSGAAPQFVAMISGYVDTELTKLNPEFHSQMSKIEAQLSKYLAGGTGLNPAAENAIYARARSKGDAEARRVRDQVMGDAAGRGFTMPPGALMSAIQQARQAGADNNAKAAAEIVAMQAEMEQKNLQFAVTTSAGLRSAVIGATMGYMQTLVQINGQALDYAKLVQDAVTEAFNLSIKAFGARLDVFRAATALYETKLKAVATKLELYRGELQALETLVGVDRLKVDIYKARIDSLVSLSNMYQSQIGVVVSQAGLEKLKLDLFQSQVQTYSAQVQAKSAEWQGYTAQINGQQARAGVFSAQVSGYAAQVSGFKTKIEAQSEVVRAQIATNQAAADQVKTAAAVFQSVVQARGAAVQAKTELERLKLSAYSEKVKADVAAAQLDLDYYKTKNTLTVDVIGKQVQAYSIAAQSSASQMQALGTVGVAGANILGNLAGAAMAGMNALAASTETI